jgi:hypothetical protein
MQTDETKAYIKKRTNAREVALLPDYYIAKLLSKRAIKWMRLEDIPKELIEAKRLQILINRKARDISYEVPPTLAELAASKPTKYCGVCKTEKDRSAFGICTTGKYSDGLRHCCKECRKLETARHSKTKKAYDKVHYRENFEHISNRNKAYGKRNRKKLNVQSNEYRQKRRDELSDDYVKQTLNGELNYKFKLGELPQELIEAKRLQLMIWRMTHEDSNRAKKRISRSI